MEDKVETLKSLTLSEDASIRDAMAKIDRGALQIAFVVNIDGVLIATITDGDIRRGLLRGVSLDSSVAEVMHSNFIAVTEREGYEAAKELMKERSLHHVPILDEKGRLVELAMLNSVTQKLRHDTRVVLMAGGLGTRLRPLTETVPKPMLPIGDKPMLEVILRNFTDQGFHNFTISLNYKGEMIRNHFGNGSKFNAKIDYIEEKERMGTAGALSLLEPRPEKPFIVMNGDLLTAVQFDALVRFHHETDALGTMCARDYPLQVPYGVIELKDNKLSRIVEKPTYSYFVNAGIYMLSPEVLDHTKPGEFLDMPTLFERIVGDDARVSVFPIQEYWMDVGRLADLERARFEFDGIFKQ